MSVAHIIYDYSYTDWILQRPDSNHHQDSSPHRDEDTPHQDLAAGEGRLVLGVA